MLGTHRLIPPLPLNHVLSQTFFWHIPCCHSAGWQTYSASMQMWKRVHLWYKHVHINSACSLTLMTFATFSFSYCLAGSQSNKELHCSKCPTRSAKINCYYMVTIRAGFYWPSGVFMKCNMVLDYHVKQEDNCNKHHFSMQMELVAIFII